MPDTLTEPGAVTDAVSIPLTQLPRGTRPRIAGSQHNADDAALLRAMGRKPNAELEVCRMGQPCIVALTGACGGGCRLGLSRELADRVLVHAGA